MKIQFASLVIALGIASGTLACSGHTAGSSPPSGSTKSKLALVGDTTACQGDQVTILGCSDGQTGWLRCIQRDGAAPRWEVECRPVCVPGTVTTVQSPGAPEGQDGTPSAVGSSGPASQGSTSTSSAPSGNQSGPAQLSPNPGPDQPPPSDVVDVNDSCNDPVEPPGVSSPGAPPSPGDPGTACAGLAVPEIACANGDSIPICTKDDQGRYFWSISCGSAVSN